MNIKITAQFETPEQAVEAAQRVRHHFTTEHIAVHCSSQKFDAYRTGPVFSDFFTPAPMNNIGEPTLFPDTFNFSALDEQEQKRERAVSHARAILSLRVDPQDAQAAAAIMRRMGGTGVRTGE